MKRAMMIAVLLVIASVGAWKLLSREGESAFTGALANTNQNVSVPLLSKAERRKLSESARLRWLERYGQVPEDADIGDMDWTLAQMTTWWGKRLDPKVFWKNRVVWLDASASKAALRHGRQWPPLPYEDKRFSFHSEDDKIDWSATSVEGPNVHCASSSKENAFWDYFHKTKPVPPEDIERQQYQVAESAIRMQFVNNRKGKGVTVEDLEKSGKYMERAAVELGYPPESVSGDALLWAFVLKERENYSRHTDLYSRRPSIGAAYFKNLPVDSHYMTEPLTPDQIKAANAWKPAYLQRLRREKADEQYIQAYLKAWSLTETEVFGAAVQK